MKQSIVFPSNTKNLILITTEPSRKSCTFSCKSVLFHVEDNFCKYLIHFSTLVFFTIRLVSGYSTLVLQLFCLQYLQEIGESIKSSIILKLEKE